MKALLDDNIGALDQAIELLSRLTPLQYRQRLPECFNACIGGHIRHNVDHYLSFLQGLGTGQIDYEARARDIVLETDRDYALGILQKLRSQLAAVPSQDNPVTVRMENAEGNNESAWGASSVRRELQFLLSHTIHHYALVAISCRLLGVPPPSDFGVAPSTLRYRAALARSPQVA